MMKRLLFFATLLLLPLFAMAQETKKVAVYVMGEDAGINKVLGSKLVSAIVRSEEYTAIERTAASSITSDGTMASSGCSLQIGGQTWYTTGNYLGYENALWTSPMKIDNLRLYSKALTANEVKAIYNAEK